MAKDKVLNQDVAVAISRDQAYLDNLLFVHSTKTFYLYDGRYYKQLTDAQMQEGVWSYVRSNFPNVNMTEAYVKDIIKQLGWCALRRVEDLETPFICLNDCLLDTDTFTFAPFDRNKVAINLIEINSTDIEMPIPIFDSFIASILVDLDLKPDVELSSFVQEMLGYYLMNSLKAQVVFFLVGDGSNGKSVMLSLLTALIGKQSCSAMSIQSLTTDKFMVSDLVGKKLNVCNEEESKFLRSDKFKALVSGDLTQAQKKYGGSFVFAPKTKYIFATNEMPTFEGLNHGLKRRIKIIPFHRIFKDADQDRDLLKKLLSELPGILGWAIEGGKRLLENQYKFSQSHAIKKTMEDFEQGVSSALRFFAEEYEVYEGEWASKPKLYDEFKQWCILNGRKSMNSSNFNKDIAKNVFGINERVVKFDGIPQRAWNIRRKIDADVPTDFEIVTEGTLDSLIMKPKW